jgi:Icc-related predicted phosphoesterase
MKIIAIGDIHGNFDKIKKMPLKGAGAILLVGDIGESRLLRKMFFNRIDSDVRKSFPKKIIKKAFSERLDSTLSILKYLAKIAPVYMMWGNLEISDKRTKQYWKMFGVKVPFLRANIKKIKNLRIIERKTTKIKGIKIGAIGFFVEDSWVRTFNPSQDEVKFKKVERKTKKIKGILGGFGKVDILLTHMPPYGILDIVNNPAAPKSWQGKHAGSKLILDYIKKEHPKYVFCGHIHEAAGQTKLGKTEIFNLGLAGYKIIEI